MAICLPPSKLTVWWKFEYLLYCVAFSLHSSVWLGRPVIHLGILVLDITDFRDYGNDGVVGKSEAIL